MSRPRICIVSHAAYGALSGGSGHIGGVERQTSLLARWLSHKGYATDMIVWDEGQDDGIMVDGVRVLKVCRREDGLPGVRFVHPRWTSLTRALARSNADVYYHNTAEYVTGQVALWCRSFERRFVFSAASQADCDKNLPLLPTVRERVLYRLGLRLADCIIVQTATQQRMVRESFGHHSEIVPMPCPEPTPSSILAPGEGPLTPRVLWVGRICPEKRPELLLDAAEGTPDLYFDIAGPVERSYGHAILERAMRLPNVTYHGPVARDAMPDLYGRAACLLCTSHVEGFPNTFLEAWSQGLPVVSTWDPDRVIATRHLGIACESTPTAVADAVRTLICGPDEWQRASEAGRAYYLATHHPELAFSKLEAFLVNAQPTRRHARTDVTASGV